MNLGQLPVYTVSQINGYLKDLLEADPLLSSLLVQGEISNYKKYPSGHHYFSLKDDRGSLRCVLFRGDAARLRFQPADGMGVLAFGRLSVFPRDGQVQLYCTQLLPDGRGALDLAFEQLRKKLEGEGLFDPARKRPLPAFPRRIALVTSPAGAAVRDMIRILGARCPIPVISAVGHEPDVTIADYVADLRAATPSNAAELAVPDQAQVSARLGQLRLRLAGGQQGRLRAARKDVERLSRSRVLRDPGALIQDGRQLADRMEERLSAALGAALKERRGALARLGAGLDAMSPLKVLGRGYAMARGERGVITRAAQSGAGERLDVLFADGTLRCEVVKKEETEPWQAKS